MNYTQPMIVELQRCMAFDYFNINYGTGKPADFPVNFNGAVSRVINDYDRETVLAYALWFAGYHNDTMTVIIDATHDRAVTDNRDVLKLYDTVPNYLLPEMTRRISGYIKFTNGSTIKFGSSVIHLKGLSLNNLIIGPITEDKAEMHIQSHIALAMSKKSKVIHFL